MKRVVIVGGGTSGWMTAAMLNKVMGKQLSITLIQSPHIGTIGVGEASIPPLVAFNQGLGIDEQMFIRETKGSYKLAIKFEGWQKPNQSYYHAFGDIGYQVGMAPFYHIAHANQRSIWDFSITSHMADNNKMAITPRLGQSPLTGPTHAYHFDAGLYAALLQSRCQQDITLIEATINKVNLSENGDIASVTTELGEVAGDLFIDCSGFKGLLIKEALGVGYESYANWLPTDRAIALPSKALSPLPNYTTSTTHDCGWMWQIPLQHRTGNGIIYSSKQLSDDEALQRLVDKVGRDNIIGQPNMIQFTPGRAQKQWHKNCVAIGLASGFLEPLESTSIHLVQSAILRLLKLFPRQGGDESLMQLFNQQSKEEFEHVRDFIILHYHLNEHRSPMWRQCRTMSLPATLVQKLALYQQSGEIHCQHEQLFSQAAWLQVFEGQGHHAKLHNPMVAMLDSAKQQGLLTDIVSIMGQSCDAMPSHEQFIERLLSRGGQ